jgi:hypothetical protein
MANLGNESKSIHQNYFTTIRTLTVYEKTDEDRGTFFCNIQVEFYDGTFD